MNDAVDHGAQWQERKKKKKVFYDEAIEPF